MVKFTPKTKLTPCRYPGGKSNALKFLDAYLKKDFTSYREPFFGGGSVGLYLMQFNKDATYWINDLYYPVYCFWKVLYENPEEMQTFLLKKRREYSSKYDNTKSKERGASKEPSECAKAAVELHTNCRKFIVRTIEDEDIFNTACLWYILNKTSYSGMAMIGSYAPLAWDQNFTENCINNLHKTSELMNSVKSLKITNLDYSELLKSDGDHDANTFIFLDPPYDIKDFLYGNNGNMHRGFNHEKFCKDANDCQIDWLITYNDNKQINEWFKDRYKLPWELQYTMKAAKRVGEKLHSEVLKEEQKNNPSDESKGLDDNIAKTGKTGKELLVANYPLIDPTSSSKPA